VHADKGYDYPRCRRYLRRRLERDVSAAQTVIDDASQGPKPVS
jgi:hypothetical protein